MLFDLSITKILVLAVIALIIFGPDQLPKIASQAGKALRDLRRIAESAKADLQEGLGPEFRDFDINDLNPKTFVRKHLLDDHDNGSDPASLTPMDEVPNGDGLVGASAMADLMPGESPPYDSEAT